MELSNIQLEIQKLGADKSLSFGCLIGDKNHRSNSYEWVIMQIVGYTKSKLQGYSDLLYRQLPYANYTQQRNGVNHIFNERMDYRFKNENTGDLRYEIIGHPITYSRLCYLRHTDKKPEVIVDGIKSKMEKWINVCFAFESNPELYNQSILEWDSVTLNLVRDFLLSIQ